MDKQPISREGYEKLREEIRRFEDEEMPKIAAQIAFWEKALQSTS